jgi:hypothetical protein
MLVARDPHGERIEASRELPHTDYHCPVCHEPVVAKPGRVVTPHFAHRPGSECTASGESARHLLAKRILAEEFRAAGYSVVLEDSYPEVGRRVDVAVTVPGAGSHGSDLRYAVEVQDSRIPQREMQRRLQVDTRPPGHFDWTYWIWTAGRATQLLMMPLDSEIRVGTDILAGLWSGDGAVCLDTETRSLWVVRMNRVIRDGGVYADKKLKTIRRIQRRRITFAVFGPPGPKPTTPAVAAPVEPTAGERDVAVLLKEMLHGSSLLDNDFEFLGVDQITTFAVVCFGWPHGRQLSSWISRALAFAGIRAPYSVNVGDLRRAAERICDAGGRVLPANRLLDPGPAPRESDW